MLETTLTHEVIAGKTQRPTYEEYLALPNEGQLVEWVDGEVVYHMPPLTSHQRIALYLAHLIQSFVAFRKLGEVFIAPFEVKCRPGGNSREPDVLFVATANLSRLSEQRLDGPADLIVEVVSDDSVARDYDEKFIEYQECGVPEYWIVDPRPRRQRALFYQRDASGVLDYVAPRGGVYHSKILPGFWLSIAWLWELPDPLLTFGEIVGLTSQTLAELAPG